MKTSICLSHTWIFAQQCCYTLLLHWTMRATCCLGIESQCFWMWVRWHDSTSNVHNIHHNILVCSIFINVSFMFTLFIKAVFRFLQFFYSWLKVFGPRHKKRSFKWSIIISAATKVFPVHVRGTNNLCGWVKTIEVGVLAVFFPPGCFIFITTVSRICIVILILCWELHTIVECQTVTWKHKKHQY